MSAPPVLFNAAFALFLERARATKGYTQDQLAERAQFKTRSTISQYESGKDTPSQAAWAKLLPALGMSLGDALRSMATAADDVAGGALSKGMRDRLAREAEPTRSGWRRRKKPPDDSGRDGGK